MIIALQYIISRQSGYWEVRTEETTEQHLSLRQFHGENDLMLLATRALKQPGEWVEVPRREMHEQAGS